MRKKDDVKPGDVEKLINQERICPVCGKSFIPPYVQMWAYVYRDRLICSWGCLQAARRMVDKNRNFQKRATDDSPMVRKILAMLEKGLTCREIAAKLSISWQNVYYYKKTRWVSRDGSGDQPGAGSDG